MKRIPLTKGAVTVIDDEDFDFVARWRWKLHPQGYACRSTWIDGKWVTLMLHRVIANTPADLQTYDTPEQAAAARAEYDATHRRTAA